MPDAQTSPHRLFWQWGAPARSTPPHFTSLSKKKSGQSKRNCEEGAFGLFSRCAEWHWRPSQPTPSKEINLKLRAWISKQNLKSDPLHQLLFYLFGHAHNRQFRNYKIIYKRYAGLFFSICVDITDNELTYLEIIHLFVEVLDQYFGNVCELDIVFNFHKVRRSSFFFFPALRPLVPECRNGHAHSNKEGAG